MSDKLQLTLPPNFRPSVRIDYDVVQDNQARPLDTTKSTSGALNGGATVAVPLADLHVKGGRPVAQLQATASVSASEQPTGAFMSKKDSLGLATKNNTEAAALGVQVKLAPLKLPLIGNIESTVGVSVGARRSQQGVTGFDSNAINIASNEVATGTMVTPHVSVQKTIATFTGGQKLFLSATASLDVLVPKDDSFNIRFRAGNTVVSQSLPVTGGRTELDPHFALGIGVQF